MSRTSLASAIALVALSGVALAAPPAQAPRAQSTVSPTTQQLTAPTAQAMRRPSPRIVLDNVAFVDALDSLIRDTLGINLAVNWPAIEAAGLDKTTPISLRLSRGVRAAKALDLILRSAGGSATQLAWYVEEGVLHVTTAEQAATVTVTRVYPVQDLIVDVPDFPGTPFDFGQNNAGANGGGGNTSLFGGGGNRRDNEDTERLTKDERGQQLADLVDTMFEAKFGNTFSNNGVRPWRVVYFNGNLIVTAPRTMQQ